MELQPSFELYLMWPQLLPCEGGLLMNHILTPDPQRVNHSGTLSKVNAGHSPPNVYNWRMILDEQRHVVQSNKSLAKALKNIFIYILKKNMLVE